MAITINATLFKDQFDSDITAEKAEINLDGAINLLNTFGAGLSNLTGDAGVKTGSYTSKQAGAIMTMAQQIYSRHYINPENAASSQLGPAGQSFSTDTQLLIYAEKLAERLKSSSIAFVVAEDTSGID